MNNYACRWWLVAFLGLAQTAAAFPFLLLPLLHHSPTDCQSKPRSQRPEKEVVVFVVDVCACVVVVVVVVVGGGGDGGGG